MQGNEVMRNWIVILGVSALFSQGCAYFVTRDEVSDVRTRIDRISKMVKERRIEEKELGVAIGKARKELARIMEAR